MAKKKVETVKEAAPETAEEKLARLLEENTVLKEKIYDHLRQGRAVHERVRKETAIMKNQMVLMLKTVSGKFKDQTELMTKLSTITETTEQTLVNVLLAIRQNEYLQAWYPPQQGHPEMKVIGTHPMRQRTQKIGTS